MTPLSKPLGAFCACLWSELQGQIMVFTGNPAPALPAAPLAMSSVFYEFIKPLLTSSQLSVSQSFLSCSRHDTERAVSMLAPLSPQVPNKIPPLVLRRVQPSSRTRNIWCSVGHTLTLSHSHPPTDCFGDFVLAQNPLAALNPRQVCTGQRSWAKDLQTAQELTGRRV